MIRRREFIALLGGAPLRRALSSRSECGGWVS
jgi:hypothetical protein